MDKLKHANGNLYLTNDQKEEMIKEATKHYGRYMDSLKLDWKNDPNSVDTPRRVAKSFVNDLASGCYSVEPKITAFDNLDGYDGMVFQGNIILHSFCSHHHLPFIGKVHVAYIPSVDGKVIGLSKLNKIVEYYARRPQIQENLTMQIHDYINSICENNQGVAIMAEANHMCVCVRGVKHNSIMKTAKLSGAFDTEDRVRQEFYSFIGDLK